MTTLYRSVLIETAEQADALPVGTIVLRTNRLPKMHEDGAWRDIWGECGMFDIVGHTALVPIEAEEVRVIERGHLERDMHGQVVLKKHSPPAARDYRRTEYWTPWEEA